MTGTATKLEKIMHGLTMFLKSKFFYYKSFPDALNSLQVVIFVSCYE